jgi:hypothetical protein
MIEDNHENLCFEIRNLEDKINGMSNPMKLKIANRQLKALHKRLQVLNSQNPVKL